jgi:hypothetical protein
MQLLATATPEFMNFSHFVLESCLVRDIMFHSSITCWAITDRSRLSGLFSLQYAPKLPWMSGVGPPPPLLLKASAATAATKVGKSAELETDESSSSICIAWLHTRPINAKTHPVVLLFLRDQVHRTVINSQACEPMTEVQASHTRLFPDIDAAPGSPG